MKNYWGFFIAAGEAVEGRAAVTFALSSEEVEAESFYVVVNDRRNVAIEDGETVQNVGGDTFDYTISASEVTPSADEVTLPHSDEGLIDDVGMVDWYSFEVPAMNIVQLAVHTGHETFTPHVGHRLEDGTNVFYEAPGAYVQGDAASTVTIGVRDAFFRGAADYIYTMTFRTFDPTAVTFTDVTSTGAGSVAEAQELTLPAAVDGELTGETPAALGAHHFQVTLEEGQALVVRTEAVGDDETDTITRLINAEGEVLIENDFHFGQTDTFFSAFVYDVPAAGDYFLVVEPYCTEAAQDGCQGNGQYRMEVFEGQ
ncbi:MAG: hypothetical protein ACNA8W_17205 [Bradymonadaceae bacterium]